MKRVAGKKSLVADEKSQARNSLRIIAGQWRGRKLHFPTVRDLRPTPDRVRETLFNWLQTAIPESACLDLFAGSGALGFEAMSRGAARVTLWEKDPTAVKALQDNAQRLHCQEIEVQQGDALKLLQTQPPRRYDIAFLDPPYAQRLLPECLRLLALYGWLQPGAWIYVELSQDDALDKLSEDWEIYREKRAGQVKYALLRFNPNKNSGERREN